MSFPEFLHELFTDGQVRVERPETLAADALREGAQLLREQEEICRVELPAGVPPYSGEAAIWAAGQFYSACQIAVFRDVGEDAIRELTKTEPVDWRQPAVHYSVDLTFKFLPDLYRIVHTAATGDPLVAALQVWCRRWPLSSVGVADVAEVEVGPIASSAGLMQMYVDRVLAREDVGRLASPPIRDAVRRSLGLYTELAPKFRQTLGIELERQMDE